jgi:hypothetical protein
VTSRMAKHAAGPRKHLARGLVSHPDVLLIAVERQGKVQRERQKEKKSATKAQQE